MVFMWLAPIIALVGLLVYALSKDPKVQRIGEICFFCGLLAFLIAFPYGLGHVRP